MVLHDVLKALESENYQYHSSVDHFYLYRKTSSDGRFRDILLDPCNLEAYHDLRNEGPPTYGLPFNIREHLDNASLFYDYQFIDKSSTGDDLFNGPNLLLGLFYVGSISGIFGLGYYLLNSAVNSF